MKSIEKVMKEIIRLVSQSSQGIRYSELIKVIKETLPEIPANTIHGTLFKFKTHLPPEFHMPSRGLYKHIKFRDSNEPIPQIKSVGEKPQKIDEEQFYSYFADWLVNELEECTKAIPLGGNKFKDKWGTPDVIGVREPKKSDIIKSPTEIISAEIKTDAQALITAFGQACAYKIFSHRSYIVVPDDSSDEDIARLDALAQIFGIGLILFDKKKKEPEFEIRVRALRQEPDMFYVNKYLKIIEDDLFS